MAALYKLTGEYLRFFEEAVESEELDQQAVLDTMESIEGDIDNKLESCCRMVRSMEAHTEGLAVEIKTLQARKKTGENALSAFKLYIKRCLETFGATKRQVGPFSLGIQKSPVSLVVADESKIPDEYYDTVRVINNARIKADLQAGKHVPGASLFQGDHLRIR